MWPFTSNSQTDSPTSTASVTNRKLLDAFLRSESYGLMIRLKDKSDVIQTFVMHLGKYSATGILNRDECVTMQHMTLHLQLELTKALLPRGKDLETASKREIKEATIDALAITSTLQAALICAIAEAQPIR